MKILSLTGGGVFGRGQAGVMELLPETVRWDAYGGTSIGAYNVLMYATGQGKIACQLLDEHGPHIFAGRWWRQWKPLCPRYPDRELTDDLRMYLPNRFGGIKPHLVIPADSVAEQRPKVFFNRDDTDAEWPAWEVARASMAAHTYFSPWKGYADGGIFLNDPVMATATCLHRHLEIPYQEMEITSIGTGLSSENMGTPLTMNRVGWALHIMRSGLSGSSVWTQRYFARAMPFGKYRHYEFSRPSGYDFDDPRVIPILKEKWADDVKRIAEKIQRDFQGA